METEGQESLSRSAIEELDLALWRCGRGAGVERLRLGEVLAEFVRRGGHHACGFSSLADYVKERCGRSGRWGSEARTLAGRLAELPRLRRALCQGVLGWSMVELLARHATAESEGALIERARGATVRQMREVLSGGEEDPEAEREREPAMRTLTVTASAIDCWAFEATRILIEHLEGGRASGDLVLEAMLAEGELTLQGLVDPALRDGAELLDLEREHRAQWLEQLSRFRAEAEARCEERIPRAEEKCFVDEEDREELPRDPVQLDALIQELAKNMTQRDLELGALARRFFAADGWRRLGYASATQYARERVGMSYSALKGHMTLSRRVVFKPAVERALREGRIGLQAAGLVARASSLSNSEAWVERAQARTVKHLQEEVRAAELIGRMLQTRKLEPPDDEVLEAVADLERHVIGGRIFREAFSEDGQMSASSVEAGDHALASQMSARLCDEAGMRTLRLRVSEETYLTYRALEQDYLRRTAGAVSFLSFLCWSVWHGWHGSLGTDVAYAGIYLRDRFRCTSPVCSRSDVTPHHLRFRSQGGDDTADNVAAVCTWCHLEGIHGGRITATPPASDIRWSLGERPVLAVQGRTKWYRALDALCSARRDFRSRRGQQRAAGQDRAAGRSAR